MPFSDEPQRRQHAFLRAGWGFDVLLASAPQPHPTLWPGTPPRLVLPTDTRCHAAAVAHAAAHLAHSGPPFARGTLKPLQQALLGTLEDARVEQAALRDLPGLLALWHPWHDATPDIGVTFAALLRRLQRRLLDPAGYADPHPWIDKAWRLHRDAEATPEAMRRLASLLGHDLGQMRLPFDAQADAIGPMYRDDHRHLWEPDPAQAEAAGESAGRDPAPPPAAQGRRVEHPEWDWRIGALRPGWCTVIEGDGQDADPATGPRRVTLPLSSVPRWRSRQLDGPLFDEVQLVAAAVARRARSTPPERVHRGRHRDSDRPPTLILLDRSASTAAPAGVAWTPARTVLEATAQAAAALYFGLAGAGHRVGLLAFSSRGRQAVRVDWLQSLDRPVPLTAPARLAALRSEGSTRMGTAVRHAAAVLRGRGPARLLLLTDGEPHDIDVHERRYLTDDLAHAVHEARRLGIDTTCLVFGARPSSALGRCFLPGACRPVDGWRDLSTLDM